MQRPTHSRLHLRDARDAHMVFEAVRLGILKPVTRRLNEIERSTFIQSGAVFVWEESEDDSGLKRWTDGRVWSQSRMREKTQPGLLNVLPLGEYDFAIQILVLRSDKIMFDRNSPGTYRFVDGMSRGAPASSAQSHYERSEHRPLGLIKQAYSAYVTLPGSSSAKPRKWHITAYFTYADLPNIPTVDQDRDLRRIQVPSGVYRSGKARSRQNSDLGMSTLTLTETPSPSVSPRPPTRMGTPGPAYMLPPLHSALGGSEGGLGRPRLDGRMVEDQRMIRMLNAAHNR
ncbi:hypothetical protein PUNSTDRAFT_45659 [Punctularia strigosozonata HHB-11173 SS5]|uniref:uncharacterized protein n=1 Tax=Punctularia strigosozonata (strain HHB-11173) TaxID=741275 RepID=UPI0004416362|nr:uncharacterized protein PUNSTDRAFT_45659 [Punctularia strigosozonata HHB-11173 SS5]EIN07191.1 hypothetical protein PUNSTDRAFT_45659 [Punctularia strigosozonata HHB-11173 SS5]